MLEPIDYPSRAKHASELVGQLLETVGELEELHPGRKFSLDGHVVGSIGEAAAEGLFDITLVRASSTGHDALTPDGMKVEIKATLGNRGVAIRPTSSEHKDAALIVLRLSKVAGEEHEIVYNGPLAPAAEAAGDPGSNGQAAISLTKLRSLNSKVLSHQRVPRRHP